MKRGQSPAHGPRVGDRRPIMALLELLGRRWALRILWELRNGPLTSRALRTASGELSPNIVQARVNDLVVTESARGRGAGRALLSRAEELARKRGCFRMALVTAGWREASVGFYRREGWSEYGAWFVKPLTDEVGPGGAATPGGPVDDT